MLGAGEVASLVHCEDGGDWNEFLDKSNSICLLLVLADDWDFKADLTGDELVLTSCNIGLIDPTIDAGDAGLDSADLEDEVEWRVPIDNGLVGVLASTGVHSFSN